MSDNPWNKVERLLNEALDRPPHERDAFLREACGDDAALRGEVESLLIHASAASGLLAEPVFTRAELGTGVPVVGRRIGPYVVHAPLGAGGMGEVYQARDVRLGREVAIKILPDTFSRDPQRRARFDREARLLAALNHAHIAAIYGVEESNGIPALVLEFVEGDTLAERIAAGPLPIAETLRVAMQIAEALDAAHEKGIVHRDLKPANIKLTPDGSVKVLDFGLAKATLDGDADVNVSRTPTVTRGATGDGTILGTAAYMSPEQARGKATDKRTDVWAFGCVLYEMLTGRAAFGGETVSDTVAAILEREPDWSALPPATPAPVRRLLRRCLDRDVKRRLRDIGDARTDLDDVAPEASAPGQTATVVAPGPARRYRALLALAAAVALAVAGYVFAPRRAAEAPEVRLEITTPPTGLPAALAISPDGQTLAFVGTSDGTSRLWLRRLNQTTAQVLIGTEDANFPFWSPNGRSIGFSVGTELKRIDLDSGAIQTIGQSTLGGTWLEDNTILATRDPAAPMVRIASTGGQPMAVTAVSTREVGHRFAQLLPDGRHFLCFAGGTDPGIYIGTLGTISTRKILDASAAAYAATGHLLFVRQGDLFSQAFDVDRLDVTGAPMLIAQDIFPGMVAGSAALSVSAAGPIVYRAGRSGSERQLRWVDRSGKELETLRGIEDMGGMSAPLSPDNAFVAWTRGGGDLWLLELARGFSTRFTFEPSIELLPTWSPDGRRLVYSANTDVDFDLYVKPISGSRGGERLFRAPGAQMANAWSPNGKFVLYFNREGRQPSSEIWAVPIDETRTPFPVVKTAGVAASAEFSPDGSWIAFQSNESGSFEIYAQPFPSGDKVRITTAGGVQPRWRPDSKELFYLGPDNRLMAVSVDFATGAKAPGIGVPVHLFTKRWSNLPQAENIRSYAVSRDGKRFLVDVLSETTTPVTVLLNWQPKG